MEAILASSVIAALLSAIISYLVSFRLKQLDFKNEYYKKVLEKRLDAYEYIERQLSLLKSVIIDPSDNKPYHAIFAYGSDEYFKYQTNLAVALSKSIWASQKTVGLMEELNNIFFLAFREMAADITDMKVIEIGKKHYQEIAEIRLSLDNSVTTDLLDLYNLKQLRKELKSRNKVPSQKVCKRESYSGFFWAFYSPKKNTEITFTLY